MARAQGHVGNLGRVAPQRNVPPGISMVVLRRKIGNKQPAGNPRSVPLSTGPSPDRAQIMSTEELPPRESMEFDVVIVGAGPSGLAAAIRLKQLNPELGIVVVEKGSEVGAHILSGAVIDPIALDGLVAD